MTPEIGIFGGSGLYTLLDDAETVPVRTAWGPPSAPLTVADVDGVGVAFLPRHGLRHELPPHRVNYRANVDAMRQVGVHTLLAPFAAGSLRPEIGPGDLVVVDQLVDRTWGRADTFHDRFDDGPRHVSLADPYTPRVRRALLEAGRATGATVHDGGTVVVINGPRFSTRAESAWHRQAGWHVVNMTQYPEAALAREAGLDFGGLALVTDYDTGLDGDPDVAPVGQEEVFEVFRSHIQRVRSLLFAAVVLLAGCGAAEEDEPEAAPSSAAPPSATMTPSAAPSSAAPSSPSPSPVATVVVPEELDFTAPTVGGGTFEGASLAGRPAVLWFWAPWCPVCRREAPLVADLASRYEDRVTFVGVAGLSGDLAAIEEFVSDGGVEGIVHLDDREGEVYSRFEVTQQYDLGLVSADGTVEVLRGPLDEDEIVAAVERLAAG